MAVVEYEATTNPRAIAGTGVLTTGHPSSEAAHVSTVNTPDSVSGGKETGIAVAEPSDPGMLDKSTCGNDSAPVDVASGEHREPEIGSTVAQPSCKMVSYHQNADLYIRIREPTGTALHFKVCFTLIAAAAPALSGLLNSRKPIVTSGGKVVFDLADWGSESDGLDVVLSIIHYKFHEIPNRPDVDLLYSIAQLTEKFNCAHLLVPYMEKWCVTLTAVSSSQLRCRETDSAQGRESRLAHRHEEGAQRRRQNIVSYLGVRRGPLVRPHAVPSRTQDHP